ncbi:MAG: TIGR00296 family protein [Methanomicrobiales archaeon]|jgi:uncharacterized protein (TIGR00296 family)|nr:TIGR00296 family protein [Methanomicrobiales archaeon]
MHEITPEEGICALNYVRSIITQTLCAQKKETPSLSEVFLEKRGVFVTLTKQGQLRGCIGFPEPVLQLKTALHDAALAAALQDPRFPPVTCQECADISIEITILTKPELVTIAPHMRPSIIQIGTHGLIIRGHGRSGLLLPQVATEWNFNQTEFLEQTCQKAGLPKNSWLMEDVSLYTFSGQIFSEHTTQSKPEH